MGSGLMGSDGQQRTLSTREQPRGRVEPHGSDGSGLVGLPSSTTLEDSPPGIQLSPASPASFTVSVALVDAVLQALVDDVPLKDALLMPFRGAYQCGESWSAGSTTVT